jgi:predicted amidohydrolase
MSSIAVVQWPDRLVPNTSDWQHIRASIRFKKADVLVTNEMPFGHWLPTQSKFNRDLAIEWCQLHELGLAALEELRIPAIISSRPVLKGERLVNEAFVLQGNTYTTLHHKNFFPNGEGWHEDQWFTSGTTGFAVHQVLDIKVGVMLCTDLMYNEFAREMGRAGAELIAAPRATGKTIHTWQTAARMAALVGGAYVASSNRVGRGTEDGPDFGGFGFAIAPGGEDLTSTNRDMPIAQFELVAAVAANAKDDYPCNVATNNR